MGVRLTAEVIDGDGNLEIMVFPSDFAAGQRPIVEATTNRNPEQLQSNVLNSAPYYVKIEAWWPAGARVEPINYRLTYETEPNGFCRGAIDCSDGYACVDGRCAEVLEPCDGRCVGLERCEPETGECLEACIEDEFGGNNAGRQSAAPIELGQLDNQTLCNNASDWFQLPVNRSGELIIRVMGEGDPIANDVHVELWGAEVEANPDPEAPPPEPLARSAFAGQLDEQINYRFPSQQLLTFAFLDPGKRATLWRRSWVRSACLIGIAANRAILTATLAVTEYQASAYR